MSGVERAEQGRAEQSRAVARATCFAIGRAIAFFSLFSPPLLVINAPHL